MLEAIYVFPASTRAAVHYMQMSLGNRILIAKIKEKEEAKKIYEEAKEEGKTVTLLDVANNMATVSVDGDSRTLRVARQSLPEVTGTGSPKSRRG